jgi:hypothetical protein
MVDEMPTVDAPVDIVAPNLPVSSFISNASTLSVDVSATRTCPARSWNISFVVPSFESSLAFTFPSTSLSKAFRLNGSWGARLTNRQHRSDYHQCRKSKAFEEKIFTLQSLYAAHKDFKVRGHSYLHLSLQLERF